ncbi:MAG: hypothetical protein ACYTFG_06830 [Planctomycetota bacterium]|jgi:hypothetical protein
MSKHLTLAVLSLVILAVGMGCSSGKIFVREGAEEIDLETEKILVLPSTHYGFTSYGLDETKMMAALVGGTIKAFGSAGVTLEPLKPAFEAAGIGGVSRRLGYGAYHSIDFHNSFDITKESCDPEAAQVPKVIAQVVTLVAEKLGLDFKPRYIFGLYMWAYGSGMVPGTAKIRFVGCLYDTEEDKIHSCCYYTKTVAKDMMMVEAVKAPGDVFGKLMGATNKAEEEAAEKEGEGEGSDSK